jgi:hypothetical protein
MELKKGAYLVHMASWCTYAHVKFVPLISHPTITYIFSFQPSHASCAPDMLSRTRGRVEMKKVELSLDET